MNKVKLLQAVSSFNQNKIISEKSSSKLEMEIKDNRIENFNVLLEKSINLTFEELSQGIKNRSSGEHYWIMPLLSKNTHLKVPEKYLFTVLQLYQEGIINKEVKEKLNKFFNTPSTATDLFVAESMLEPDKSMIDITMNYRFLKLIEEHINKK